MKKIGIALLLLALLWTLSGCRTLEDTLHQAGEKIKSNQVETPQNNGGDIDWSFVPVVRDMAVKTFTEGFPDAVIKETNVASKNGASDHVIVILTYEMGDKHGEYGFDYEKDESGEFVLKRYGDGVSVDDL